MQVWQRSSYCGSGQCVEVARSSGRILVRDSRGDTSPILEFRPAAWREFLLQVR
jgi:hypothetical protein